MLRGPLGDPRLRLVFWRSDTHDWADDDGVPTRTVRAAGC